MPPPPAAAARASRYSQRGLSSRRTVDDQQEEVAAARISIAVRNVGRDADYRSCCAIDLLLTDRECSRTFKYIEHVHIVMRMRGELATGRDARQHCRERGRKIFSRDDLLRNAVC